MAIHLLDKHTAELIAAGEVVERPASVVKELCENAIDAGATTVLVEIERGGISLIRIEDDGAGIAAGDIPLAFVRHATSKVRTQADLDAIGTLGFRGEALASVASVARVQLLTKSGVDDDGTVYHIAGGQEEGVQPAARPRGTTITVRDLFYNTPARMKFLKKDASEAGFVTETVTRLALSHPEIAFRYNRDGKQVFATPGGGDLRGAVFAVLGAAFGRGLLPVSGGEGTLQVDGLVTVPQAARASRSMQFFFINGRFVKNRTIMAAMEQAYRGTTMHGKFPGGVLFLHMPYELVDVNVHPAKTEVRFADEKQVFSAVYRTVKAALMEQGGTHSQFSFGQQDAEEQTPVAPAGAEVQANSAQAPAGGPLATPPVFTPQANRQSPADGWASPGESQAGMLQSDGGAMAYQVQRAPRPYLDWGRKPLPTAEFGLDISADEDKEAPESSKVKRNAFTTVDPPVQITLNGAAEAAPRLRLVGELFKTYIAAELGDTLCLIDKHAAHERILYEKLVAARQQGGVQQLLAPVSVALSAAEKNALLQNEEALQQAGIELEDFGGNSVLARGVPADVPQTDIEALVVEVAGRLAANEKDAQNEKTEWVLHSMACRAAVKGGDHTPPEGLLQLAQDIIDGKVPPFCPHGRPVVLEITRKELEKQFGRLG